MPVALAEYYAVDRSVFPLQPHPKQSKPTKSIMVVKFKVMICHDLGLLDGWKFIE